MSDEVTYETVVTLNGKQYLTVFGLMYYYPGHALLRKRTVDPATGDVTRIIDHPEALIARL